MRPRSLAVLLLALGLSIPALAAPKKSWREAQVLVKYESGFAPETGKHGVKRAKKLFGAFKMKGKAKQHADARGLDRVYLLELHRDDVESTIDALRKQPGVVYAEPNWIIEFPATPNDPSYAAQWGLAKIGAPAAWDSATSGNGVVVGVVDTGIDLTHPDLAANLWTNPGEIAGNGVDDDGNGFVDDVHGWDFYGDDNDPTDTNGHGTRVAGIIGAVGNNATGVSGVAWSAKLAALKTGVASGDVAAAVQAIEYANMMGFKITNNSWGWWEGGQSFLLDDVIEAGEAAGNLFIVAAGNETKNNDWLPTYPAHYATSNVISVTATTSADALASFANYGATTVDIAAPGEAIESTVTGGTYGSGNGTSFATPFVAGAAALYWTANPAATHTQVRDAILLSSDPLTALQGKTVSGGRLNLANLFSTDTIAPAAISDLVVAGATHRSVTLRFTAVADATRYDVRVSESPITAANWDQATPLTGEPIPQTAGTLETFTLSGLDASKNYYAAVRVLDSARNASTLSNVASFTTARAAVVFADDVEGGARDWTVEGSDGNGGPALWHIDGTATSHHWNYQIAGGSNYDTGARNWGTLTTPEIDLTQADDARLRFKQHVWTERHYGDDMARVLVSANGGPWTLLLEKMSTDYVVRNEEIDLSAYDGQRVRIRFELDTIDANLNAYQGWTVDDVIVDAVSSNAPPTVDATVPALTEDAPATLTASGSDPEGATLEYKWSFGDGTHAYTRNTTTTHTWTLPGTYTVTLIAYDGSNANDPDTVTVTVAPVNDRPVAVIDMAFAPPPHLEETGIRVTYFGSSDEEGSPLQCRFDYGDGGTITSACSGSWTYAWQRPGTYTITLIVNDGELDSLPATQSITIQEASNDKPVANAGGPYDAHPNDPITFNGSASSDEETSIASYLWTFPDATTATGASPVKSFASGGHNVSLVVTDQTGLASNGASTFVRVCGGASARLYNTATAYFCPGGTAKVGVGVLSGFAPMTLTWSDGYSQAVTQLVNGYAERIVTPSAPTSYALASMTDFLGCAGTVDTTPQQFNVATASLANYTIRICSGQSATLVPTLAGSGPWTLTWSDGYVQTNVTNGSRTVTPSETTAYSIVSATCASCSPGTTAAVSGTMTVQVMAEPLSAVVSGGGTSCNGGSVAITATITGGAPPYTVTWSDFVQSTTSTNTATRNVAPSSATTYTASVSAGNCSVNATGSATVTPWAGTRPSVTSVSGSTSICTGGSATITASLAGDGLPFTLTWSDGYVQTVESLTATRTVSPSSTTTYSVTSIVNAAGCSGTRTGNATVSVSAPPTATVSGGGSFCTGSTSRINVSLTGVGPFDITWSDGLTETRTSSSFYRDVAPETATIYSITSITDSRCDGTASGSATVTPASYANVHVSGGGAWCPGSPATITATITGGLAPHTITWSDGVTQQVSGTTATREVTPGSMTTYSVTSISPASCGASYTGSAIVSPSSPVTVVVSGGGTACPGSPATITAAVSGGGSGSMTLLWSDGVTQSVTSGTTASRQISYVNPAATYTVTSISPAACGSTITGSAAVTPSSPVTVSVSGGGTFCEGSSATIQANVINNIGPVTILWSDGVTQQTTGGVVTRQVAPGTTTSYSVTSVSPAACGASITGGATVTPSSPVTVVVSGGGVYCPGNMVTVQATITGGTATGLKTLVWSDGYSQTVEGTLATRQVWVSSPTTYTVTSISPNACGASFGGSAYVYPAASPTANVSGGGTFCEGTSTTITATLTGTAPFNITWSDGFTQTVSSGTTATRTVTPANATTYTITALTDANCTGSSSGSATATPIRKPVITQQPQSKTIAKGTTTTLTVTTSESGLNYQWYQGTSGNTSNPVGTNSSTYTTPKLRSTTSYWVKIWKSSCAAYPTNSNTATITIP